MAEGKVLWKARPEVQGTRVVSVPTSELWWQGGLRIHRGRRYRVVAVCENPTGRMAPDEGMGVVAGAALAPNADWPPLDRDDPAYVQDLRRTFELPRQRDGHGGHGAEPRR